MNTRTENPHQRRSIRLSEYDYSNEGFYFITICVHQHRPLFGTIVDGTMHLNSAGRMVEEWYYRLADKYPHITCHEHVVMPNHFHCIIQINSSTSPNTSTVGAGSARPNTFPNIHPDSSTVRASLVGAPNTSTLIGNDEQKFPRQWLSGTHKGRPYNGQLSQTLGGIVGAFKSMTTNAYIRGVKQHGWPSFHTRLWQRNYYEHIIRNQRSYDEIAAYIIENPIRWADDKYNF